MGWPSEADERLRRGVRELVQAVSALGGAVGWVTPPSDAEADAWLEEVLADVRAGRVRLAVLTEGVEVLALGLWWRYPVRVLAANAELRKVMTAPHARGRGLGRTVVRALVEDARRAGVETLTLDVRGNNTAAMTLYEAEGFEVWGRLPDFIAVGDERFDRVCYRLHLGVADGAVRRGGLTGGPGSS